MITAAEVAAADLAAEVADAHGTAVLAAADHITVSFSSGGLAFAAKRQPDALAHVQARLAPVRQEITLDGRTPEPWTLDVVDSHELNSRLAALRNGRRRFRWQPHDLGVFAAAAIWTYLTLPLLLDRAVQLDRRRDTAGLRRLRIQLPATIAGHGSPQTLHIDSDGLIRRHDYTATAFGAWARAAHLISSYETFDGIPIGTTRRVTPRLGRPLPVPTLVWIQIHSVRLG
jgi:hypothetical protein